MAPPAGGYFGGHRLSRVCGVAVLSIAALVLVGGRLSLLRSGRGNTPIERRGTAFLKGTPTVPAGTSKSWVDVYFERGFGEPFRLLPESRAHNVVSIAYTELNENSASLGPLARNGSTALHAASRELASIASSPEIVRRVQAVLGPDIILYQTQLAVRSPGVNQQYHSDTSENTSCGHRRAVGVWVALRDVNFNATLELLPYTHTLPFGPAQQELESVQGRDWATGGQRHEAAGKVAEELASARLRRPVRWQRLGVTDGEAALFHMALWHGSVNVDGGKERQAVVFRYKHADCPHRYLNYQAPVDRKDRNDDELPPFEVHDERPPVLLLGGAATPERLARNLVVSWEGTPTTGGGGGARQVLPSA